MEGGARNRRADAEEESGAAQPTALRKERCTLQYHNLCPFLKKQNHIFANHLQIIYGLLQLGKPDRALKYIEDLSNSDHAASEGPGVLPVEISDLFRRKDEEARCFNIDFSYEIGPDVEGLHISKKRAVQLSAVLESIIDNGIDAAREGLSFDASGETPGETSGEVSCKTSGKASFESSDKASVKASREVSRAEAVRENGIGPVGSVNIKVCKESGMMVFYVSNTGKAIPREAREHIFEPGFTTKEGRDGMGLFVAKCIMSELGGSITLEEYTRDDPGRTVFKVTLHEEDPV